MAEPKGTRISTKVTLNACSRTRQSRAADASVVDVGKHVDNFTVINSEAERLSKLNSQMLERLVTLIFTYRRNIEASFGAIFNPFVFLPLRYGA
jgi:hypothetical protein